MNSYDIQDDVQENNNNLSGEKNFISYLSDIFLGNNNTNDNNNNNTNDYDDVEENLEESHENLMKLSKMNISKICEYLEIDDIYNQKQHSYNKKYSNILTNTNNYETDYELKINSNETITFLKFKK